MAGHFGATAVLALALVLAPLASAQWCPIGQVYDYDKGRCAQCGFGLVKEPNVAGADDATCESARLVCGTAEVAKYGSCYKCPSTQIAVDDVKCANCPPGYKKFPSGSVSNAICKRTSPSCVAQQEVCNGRDDDCDGKVDEDLGTVTCGYGPCVNTVPKCLAGRLQDCRPRTVASREVCDGIDNDCDGKVDNNIPSIFCTPCNLKVAGCTNGVPGSCDGVCTAPCCSDCSSYSSPTAKAKCFLTCDRNCKEINDCLDWADSVGDKVAQVACQRAAEACGLLAARNVIGGRQVPIVQCYYAAYDQCTSRGEYYIDNARSGACSYYYSGVSTSACPTVQSFQDKVVQELEGMCDEVAKGIALSLP